MNTRLLAGKLMNTLKEGMEKPLFTAVQCVVSEPDCETVCISMGKTKLERMPHRLLMGCKLEGVTNDTLFDVASLTKVLSTTSLAMCAVEEKKLRLDQKLVGLLDDPLPGWLMGYTIGHLLTHSTPLAAWADLHGNYAVMQAYDITMRRIMAQIGSIPPRNNLDKCCYSDLGFITLGHILENVYGKPLDVLFSEKITKPLGIDESMMYRPLHHVNQASIAATKLLYRVQLQGHTDDDNARAMLHLGGHAGVFATATAINKFMRALLDGNFPVSSKLVEKFLTYHAPNTTFALGWDRPTSETSLSGRMPGDPVVGHLGYTGCSMWMDLDTKRCVTLLTNRSAVNKDPASIADFRREVHAAVWQS